MPSRVALVTGANHGIGMAAAVALAERGVEVVASYLRGTNQSPEEHPRNDGATDRTDAYHQARNRDGSHVEAAVSALGATCVTVEADLTDPLTPSRLFDEAEAKLGPVNILVHNASGWTKDSFADGGLDPVGRPQHRVTTETIDAQYQVDARAGALLMNEFIWRHRSRGADWGRIVTMTSGEGGGFPGEASYGAAKAALISYTLTAASEMATDGVTANVVYPPVTDTGWVTDEVRAFVAEDLQHHHVADPSEVAEVIAWLCTEAGRIVTGNVIRLR